MLKDPINSSNNGKEYEFNPNDFDLNLLLDFENKKIIESTNFSTITQICHDTLKYSGMCGIVAEPGYGKSVAFEYFINNNKNVHYMAVNVAMTAKDFYNKILDVAGWTNIYKEVSLYNIIRSIGYYLTQSQGKHLIIIDEAGKLNDKQRLCLHDLRDAVNRNTGIILAGPKYFQTDIYAMNKKYQKGIPELLRRIEMFIELEPPSNEEKRALLKVNGFKDQLMINSIVKRCDTLAQVYNEILTIAKDAVKFQENIKQREK